MMTQDTAREATMETGTGRVPPVVRSVDVRWGRSEAFERFTAGIARWWPLPTHSVGQSRARTVVFEGEVGGRLYEVDDDGSTHTWGTVLEWDPPIRVRFTWHPGGEPDIAQDVEVRFEEKSGGTRLVLTHSGWEVLGRKASKARFTYNVGWIPVLDRWADRRTAAGVIIDGLTTVVALFVSRRQRD